MQRAQKDDANVVADTFVSNEGTIEFFKSLGFKSFETIFLLDRKKRLRLNKHHLSEALWMNVSSSSSTQRTQ